MKKILGFLSILVVTIMLTACGNKGMVGTYELLEMEENGEKLDASAFSDLGITFSLEIQEGNKAYLDMAGDKTELTYDDKTFTGKDEETGEEESIPYTLDGDKITLSKDGSKIVFKKK